MTTLQEKGITIFVSQHKLIEPNDLITLGQAIDQGVNCKMPVFENEEYERDYLDVLMREAKQSGAHVEKRIDKDGIMIICTYRLEQQDTIDDLARMVLDLAQVSDESEDWEDTVYNGEILKNYEYSEFEDGDVLIQLY